jgi:hypothetical protein
MNSSRFEIDQDRRMAEIKSPRIYMYSRMVCYYFCLVSLD